MVPISRGKQLTGIVGAIALGYALSWAATPGPGTGPVDHFAPTFGATMTPVIVAPAEPVTPMDEQPRDASQPRNFDPRSLQAPVYEPI